MMDFADSDVMSFIGPLDGTTSELALSELKPLGPGMPAATFDVPWSALHFITPPDAPYDVWISYLELR
jgi:hypothetical protein